MTSDVLHAGIHRDFRAAQAGDKAAYGRLIEATQRMVMGIAMAHTRDRQLSEDITQETYLRGWTRLADITRAESFLPWLRQVARNQAIDHFRARRHREEALSPDDHRISGHSDATANPECHVLDVELSDWLRDAIEQVPEDTREVLLLFYMEGQSSQQVAALLGMSDANVRKRLQRARALLNAQFEHTFADAAVRAKPGPALASAVLAALGGTGSTLAKAAVTGTAAKAGGSLLTGAGMLVAGLFAAIGAVFVGVWMEIRDVLRQVRSSARRRAMIVNGVVYAALMVGFILGLQWTRKLGWGGGETMLFSVVVSVLVVALALHRAWLIKRDKSEH
ncbi:MAG: sigma-70 family RNA polymerase sigma factor [Xanthomonadales bacterium]|nr:sigma-70 family RNA polymerase sigma factor [Xanthomonadales bacterium]